MSGAAGAAALGDAAFGNATGGCYGDAGAAGLAACVGTYCGRPLDDAGCLVTSDICGACPRGSRTDGYVCVPCGPVPVVSYDVMFFTFWIVAVSASHALALYATPRTPWRAAAWLYATIAVEVTVSALLAVLSVDPLGSLQLNICATDSINDWYTTFFNPATYGAPIYCASEPVYPRWSVVFLFMAYATALMVVLRVPVSRLLAAGAGRSSILGALFYMPFYAVVNGIFGGVIYYAFPYMLLVITTTLQYLAIVRRQQFGLQRVTTFDRVLFGSLRYLLMAFAIVSLFMFFMPDGLLAVAVSLVGALGPFVLIGGCFLLDLTVRAIARSRRRRWRRRA